MGGPACVLDCLRSCFLSMTRPELLRETARIEAAGGFVQDVLLSLAACVSWSFSCKVSFLQHNRCKETVWIQQLLAGLSQHSSAQLVQDFAHPPVNCNLWRGNPVSSQSSRLSVATLGGCHCYGERQRVSREWAWHLCKSRAFFSRCSPVASQNSGPF